MRALCDSRARCGEEDKKKLFSRFSSLRCVMRSPTPSGGSRAWARNAPKALATSPSLSKDKYGLVFKGFLGQGALKGHLVKRHGNRFAEHEKLPRDSKRIGDQRNARRVGY